MALKTISCKNYLRDRKPALTLRVTVISPVFVRTELVEAVTKPEVGAESIATRDKMIISPMAIAHAIVYEIEPPDDIDMGESSYASLHRCAPSPTSGGAIIAEACRRWR